MTLTEFYLARLDELGAKAADVHWSYCSAFGEDDIGPLYMRSDCNCGWPGRILTDIAAKRKIVELALNIGIVDGIAFDTGLLETLVQPFSSHPDFSPEWKTP